MIYLTGDLHGEMERFQAETFKRLKKGDTLIVCGDFGFVWDGSTEEKKRLKKLGNLKYQILFVPGCHDNYDLLASYPEVDFAGGRARQISEKVYELLRGEIYEIEGKKIFAFGGGIDEDSYLREEGRSWWKEEIPTEQEYEEAIRRLSEHDNEVDYIVTHDSSATLKQFLNMEKEDGGIEKIHAFFNVISKNVKFSAWYFGKYHQDKVIPPHYYAMFQQVRKAPGQEDIRGKKKKKA